MPGPPRSIRRFRATSPEISAKESLDGQFGFLTSARWPVAVIDGCNCGAVKRMVPGSGRSKARRRFSDESYHCDLQIALGEWVLKTRATGFKPAVGHAQRGFRADSDASW